MLAFDWGLIIVTALAGASAAVSGVQRLITLGDVIAAVAFIALVIAGIGAQKVQLKGTEAPPSS